MPLGAIANGSIAILGTSNFNPYFARSNPLMASSNPFSPVCLSPFLLLSSPFRRTLHRGKKVVDVVGWAPTADTLALAENKCTKQRFQGYTIVQPTVNTGHGPVPFYDPVGMVGKNMGYHSFSFFCLKMGITVDNHYIIYFLRVNIVSDLPCGSIYGIIYIYIQYT